MFEQKIRRSLQLGFVMLCVLPTVWTSGWLISHQLDFRTQAYEQLLTRHSGMIVDIGRVRFPRPGQVLLLDVRAIDPETSSQVLECRCIEICHVDGGSIVVCSHPSVLLRDFAELRGLLEYRYFKRPWPQRFRFDLHADQLTIAFGDESYRQTFSFIAQCENRSAGPFIEARFALAGDPVASGSTLRIARDRSGETATTETVLICRRPVPCSFLDPQARIAAYLGAAASFQGRLEWTTRAEQWRLGMQDAKLRDIDLGKAMKRLPHDVSGFAEVTIPQAHFAAGDIGGEFQVQIGPGDVSVDLLQRIATELDAELQPDLDESSTAQFERCSFTATVERTARGVTCQVHPLDVDSAPLIPADSGLPSAGIVFAATGPLLSAPADPFTPLSLAKALLPSGSSQIPLVSESKPLLHWLPLPNSLELPVPATARAGSKVELVNHED